MADAVMLTAVRSTTAGRSSELRFKEQRRARMRAEWRHLALLVGCLLALALWIALDSGWRQIFAAIAFGAFAAILAIGWMLGFDARSLRFRVGSRRREVDGRELTFMPS